MKKISRRTFLSASGVTLAAAALASCGGAASSGAAGTTGGDAAGTASGDAPSIRFLSRFGTDTNRSDAGLLEVLDQFIEANPDINVTVESVAGDDDTTYFNRVKSYIAVGDPADVVHNYGGSAMYEYAEAGTVLDLEPYFEADPGWKETYYDMFDLWQWPSVPGTYGVPLRTFAVQMYYNQSMFDANGLKVPETIEEFEEVADAFLDKGIVPFALGGLESWRFAHLSTVLEMKKYGPQLITDLAARTKKYTDPEMTDVFSTVKRWHDAGYFGQNVSSISYDLEKSMFENEETPMHMDGTWYAETLAAVSAETGLEILVKEAFPYYKDYPDFKYNSMGGADGGMSIFDSGDQARSDAAVACLKFVLSPESVDYNYENGGGQYIAVNSPTGKSPFPSSPLNDSLIASFEHPEAVYRQEVDMYDSLVEMQDTYRNAVQSMAVGVSAEEAVAAIQAVVDAG